MTPRNPGPSSTAKILPFPAQRSKAEQRKILRLSPEYDGQCLLYKHQALSSEKLYAIRILCWARLADGRTVALVPWLGGVSRCIDLDNPQTGQASGYYDPKTERCYSAVPNHHITALDTVLENAPPSRTTNSQAVQEIPDMIGSHAAILNDEQEYVLESVVSWQLCDNGEMKAMLADPKKITQLPVLAGDPCLYAAQDNSGFRYYFQYHIANQIKNGGAMSTRALNKLLHP